MVKPGGEADEMNPLSSVLGFTFWPLVASNIVLSGALLYGHWWYCHHYEARLIQGSPKNRWQFLSLLHYGRPDQELALFIRSGRHPKLYYAQLLHCALQAVALISVLVTFHNLGQFHSWAVQDTLRELLVYPMYVIYALLLLLTLGLWVRMAGREFRTWKSSQHLSM